METRKSEWLAAIKPILDREDAKRDAKELAKELGDILEINIDANPENLKQLTDEFNKQLSKMGKQPIVFSEKTLNGIVNQFAEAIVKGFKTGVGKIGLPDVGFEKTNQGITKTLEKLSKRRIELNKQMDNLEHRMSHYENLFDLLDEYDDVKPLKLSKDEDIDEQALRIQGAFVKAEDAVNAATRGTKEYNTALIKALEAAKDLYRMSKTLDENKDLVKDKTILVDFEVMNLKDTTADIFDLAEVDFKKFIANFDKYRMAQVDKIKAELTSIQATMDSLNQQDVTIVEDEEAKVQLKTLQEIESAYDRISKKRATKNGHKPMDKVIGALEYIPGDASLATLKNRYNTSLTSGADWEEQYQWAIKFVKEYEASLARINAEENKIDKKKHLVTLNKYTELYNSLKPLASGAEASLLEVAKKAGYQSDKTAGSAGSINVPDVEAAQKVRKETEKKAEAEKRVEESLRQQRIEEEKIAEAKEKQRLEDEKIAEAKRKATKKTELQNTDSTMSKMMSKWGDLSRFIGAAAGGSEEKQSANESLVRLAQEELNVEAKTTKELQQQNKILLYRRVEGEVNSNRVSNRSADALFDKQGKPTIQEALKDDFAGFGDGLFAASLSGAQDLVQSLDIKGASFFEFDASDYNFFINKTIEQAEALRQFLSSLQKFVGANTILDTFELINIEDLSEDQLYEAASKLFQNFNMTKEQFHSWVENAKKECINIAELFAQNKVPEDHHNFGTRFMKSMGYDGVLNITGDETYDGNYQGSVIYDPDVEKIKASIKIFNTAGEYLTYLQTIAEDASQSSNAYVSDLQEETKNHQTNTNAINDEIEAQEKLNKAKSAVSEGEKSETSSDSSDIYSAELEAAQKQIAELQKQKSQELAAKDAEIVQIRETSAAQLEAVNSEKATLQNDLEFAQHEAKFLEDEAIKAEERASEALRELSIVAEKNQQLREQLASVKTGGEETGTPIDMGDLKRTLGEIVYQVKITDDGKSADAGSLKDTILKEISKYGTLQQAKNASATHVSYGDKTVELRSLIVEYFKNTIGKSFDPTLFQSLWKEAREKFAKFTPYEITRDDAIGVLKEKIPDNILDGWFRNGDSEYKSKLEELAMSDEEIRNAALNLMRYNFQEYSGKKIDFSEFLNLEIPVYRGKNSEKYTNGDEFLAMSFDRKTAEKFGQHVLETFVKPLDTLGAYQTTGEFETLVKRGSLESRPEYQKWLNSMSETRTASNDELRTLEEPLAAIKEILGQIQANTARSESLEVEPAKTDVGPVLATEGTLVAIKSAVEAINQKVVKGVPTDTSDNHRTGNTTGGVNGKDAESHTGSQYFPEKLKTQTVQLAKFRAQLLTTGKLTDDIDAQIYNLLDELKKVQNGPDFSVWSQKFQQLKASVGITGIFDKVESKEETASYKQLIEYQKTRNKLELEYTKAQDGSALKQFYAEQLAQMDSVIANQQEMIDNEEYAAKLAKLREEQERKLGAVEAKAADKDAKKNATTAKKAAQKDAMLGKAGNAVGRAETAWMNAGDITPEASPEVNALIDEYYQKIIALRQEKEKLRQSESITQAEKDAVIQHTQDLNRMTTEVQELVSEYQKLSGANVNEANTRSTSLTGASSIQQYQQQMKAYVNEITHGRGQIKSFDAATKTLTYTVKNGSHEFAEYTVALRRVDNSLVSVQGTTKKTETFFEATKRKIGEISSYITGMGAINLAKNQLKQGIRYIKEIDDALTELKKVTNETTETYDKFLKTAAKTADKTGSTMTNIISSTADWVKLGNTLADATSLAETTSVLLNVSEFESIDSATSALVSTMQAFGYAAKDSMSIVDVMNEIGNNYAVSSDGIATALQDSASSLVTANNSYEEAVAMIAAGNRVVQDPSSLGSGLRTIALRLRGTSVEGEDDDGLITSTSKLQSKIKALSGVNILTDTGAYKSTYQILLEISDVWEQMSDIDQAECCLYVQKCA